MKKIISISISRLVALILLTTLASCLSEMNVDESLPSDQLTIHVAFTKSPTPATTRLIESGDFDGTFNENKVVILDVFFYQGNTLKWKALSADINYNTTTNIATLPIPADKQALFDGTVEYDVYVVANSSANYTTIVEGDDNAADLKSLVMQSGDFVTKGGSATPQNSFLMDGVITKTIDLNDPNLGTVNLERAAAKIRLRLVDINVPGFECLGNCTAKLMHFTDKTALLTGGSAPTLGAGDWKSTSAMPLSATAVGGGQTTQTPFYAYANNWQGAYSDRESYIELTVPLRDTANDITGNFKYRIPLTPQNLTGEDATNYKNVLHRNYLYDIAVTIKIIGRVDEDPEEVTGNYTIKSWDERNIYINVMGAHYLVVSETDVTMPNVANYTLTFNSSVANVTLVDGSLKATYTYVDYVTGQPVTANVAPAQMPTVTVQPNVASGTIQINSPIPVNYIPKDIEFKVTNGQSGLIETVIIRQLPSTYFTSEEGERSILRNQLLPQHTNPYMYAITTLAPSGDGNIIWGFPLIDNGNTVNSLEVSRMVSPKFMMASQLGATSTMGYDDAVDNCNSYWEETIKNGVTVRYDDWRLPTEAEIKYIDDLQHDSNNPQGVVMRGNYYWDAYSFNGAYEMKDPITHSGSSTSAHVRCIRDIKN